MKLKRKTTKKNKGILIQEGRGSGRGKQTKSISWKSELVEIKYFDSYENERSNSAKFETLKMNPSIESEIENTARHSEPNGSICIGNSFHSFAREILLRQSRLAKF